MDPRIDPRCPEGARVGRTREAPGCATVRHGEGRRADFCMLYSVLADLVVALHATFVAFVVLGGLLALRWPRAAWLHVPCALWGMGLEFLNGICPLTPLEVGLRHRAGELGYAGGFIERYLLPVLYPQGLTREIEIGLGVFVLVLNVVLYGLVHARWRRSRRLDPVNPD